MKSKTKISKQAKRKTNPELVETILQAKKHKEWMKVADLLSRPRREKISFNLEEIERESREGDTFVVPGKVLGTGKISKKIRIAALNFSEEAREKLKEKKCEAVTIKEELKKNPKAQGVRILS